VDRDDDRALGEPALTLPHAWPIRHSIRKIRPQFQDSPAARLSVTRRDIIPFTCKLLLDKG
jgi:hypothetical protein